MDILNTSITSLLHNLHRNEHVKAHEDLRGAIKTDVENIPEVKKNWDEYEAGVERLKLIFRHSPESPETKHISGFDERRDELWLGGKKIVKLYTNSPDPGIQAAAEEVRILMNAYGDVPRFSLYGETGSLKHAIEDLKKPENQAKVALIPGLTALVAELETVNDSLDALYKQRLKEVEAVKKLGKLADYLPLVDKQLINLFHALNTVYDYNEMTAKLPALKATLERIAENAEAILDQLRKVVARRGVDAGGKTPGTGGGEGGEGGPTDPQTPNITDPEAPFE